MAGCVSGPPEIVVDAGVVFGNEAQGGFLTAATLPPEVFLNGDRGVLGCGDGHGVQLPAHAAYILCSPRVSGESGPGQSHAGPIAILMPRPRAERLRLNPAFVTVFESGDYGGHVAFAHFTRRFSQPFIPELPAK